MNNLFDNVRKFYIIFKNMFGGFLVCYFGVGALLGATMAGAGGIELKVGPFGGLIGFIFHIIKTWWYFFLVALFTMNIPYEIIKGWIKSLTFKKMIDVFELIFFVFLMGYIITKIINLWTSL